MHWRGNKMLLKYCRKAGCGRLVEQPNNYCDEHRRDHTVYDKGTRKAKHNEKYAAFYNSRAWKTVAARVKQRDLGLCVECRKAGVVRKAAAVHHREPIKTQEGWTRRFDETNLVSVCAAHHDKLEKEAARGGGGA